MKTTRTSILLAIAIFLLLPTVLFSQEVIATDTARTKLINAAKEIMVSAGTCALITLDEEGRPRVRAMDPFIPESDLTVWFGTKSESRKVDQIKKDQRVTLYYLDSDVSGYVMIHGNAQIVEDAKEKEKHWKDRWESFYPNKPEGYSLIKVSPIWVEVISETRGIYGDTISWQPPIVYFELK